VEINGGKMLKEYDIEFTVISESLRNRIMLAWNW